MRNRDYIQTCSDSGCDYLPCLDNRIAELEQRGLDSTELLAYRDTVRLAEGRFWAAEAEWLAALDSGAR
jgi:hypothetical protein